MTYCKTEWPATKPKFGILLPYWHASKRFPLTQSRSSLVQRLYIVVATAPRTDVLHRIDCDLQGIVKCRLHVKTSVCWLEMLKQIAQMVYQCSQCVREERVANDYLSILGKELDKKKYLVVVEYYSRYPKVIELTPTTSDKTIDA